MLSLKIITGEAGLELKFRVYGVNKYKHEKIPQPRKKYELYEQGQDMFVKRYTPY
jgi:hypothetical protein